MKAKLLSISAAAAGTLLLTTPAHADDPILTARCATDQLSIAQAVARLEWARACGTRINVVSPVTPTAPASTYNTGLISANGVSMWEYVETDDFFGRNSYSGEAATVNQMFMQNQFRLGPVTATTVAGGFQRWTEPVQLPRPYYPTFGTNNSIAAATQLFPPPALADGSLPATDCNFYLDAGGVTRANVTVSGFWVNGYCTASCYTPDQNIRFSNGDENILSAMTALRTGVTTLTPTSTLDKIQLRTDDVYSYTRELRDSTHVIYEIRTASGGELRVTDKHPVLDGTGRIVEARTLKPGNELIKPDGKRDPIVSVTKTTHVGKVYNLKPKATNRIANILIAQGFLVGSSRYQNEDVDYVNRIILDRAIPKDVIPQ